MSTMNNLPPLWAHQKRALDASQSATELALFFDIGTGKSRTAIDILRYRCAAHNQLLRTLILSPKITLLNWKREIAKYSKIHPRDVHILEGSQGKRVKMMLDQAFSKEGTLQGKIFITNYEALEMQELFELLMKWNPEVIIGDEAHRLKNHQSKRAKAAIKLADQAIYRYVLTGTPILNTGLDIFNIFRFLDKGATFGTNYWRFRSIWFEDENAQWSNKQNHFEKWVPRPETYAEMNKLIYTKALRAVKSECLDLPPFVRKQIFVELSKEQQRLYNEMKAEYIAYIDDVLTTETPRAVVAQMAVTKALRLQQIITGYAKDEFGEIHRIKENPRLDALSDLLKDLTPNHKVIVWATFQENYEDIAQVCKDLKIDYTELHGKIPQKDRDRNMDRFNGDPACRVLIGNQLACGIGVNLIASDVSIYYSKNFSLEQDLQSEGRNYRGGSEVHQKVTRIDIVSPGTIDEIIDQALSAKQEIGDKILDLKEKL